MHMFTDMLYKMSVITMTSWRVRWQSNHRHLDCLLNPLFRHGSKKTSKLRVTGLCEGNSLVTGEFPHKGPVTQKTFPFDDVISSCIIRANQSKLITCDPLSPVHIVFIHNKSWKDSNQVQYHWVHMTQDIWMDRWTLYQLDRSDDAIV